MTARLTEAQAREILGKAGRLAGRDPGKKWQALGRKKPGRMNKTEQRFVDEWITPHVMAGEIVWWAFEAVKLRLADNTHLTIDFFVMRADGSLSAIDTKGAKAMLQEDAHAKTKIAGELFPWPFFYAIPKKGGGWNVSEV